MKKAIKISPLISVIVPVFNLGSYIRECIDSTINQTYKNLEIILVDDGSTDDCPEICDNFAKQDKRIKVIHKKNSGVSDARNCAIDICTGDYITFIDGDDFISKDMVELLYKNLTDNKCEVSICGHIKYYGEINEPNNDNKTSMLYSIDALSEMLYQCSITNSPWAKLYKKSLFSAIRYQKGLTVAEDLEVTYRILSKAERIVVSSSQKYFYRQRLVSAANSEFTINRMDGIKITSRILANVANNHNKIIRAAENRHFMEAIYIYRSILNSKSKLRNEREVCANIIKLYRRNVIVDNKSRPHYRLLALFSYFGISMSVSLINLRSLTKRPIS